MKDCKLCGTNAVVDSVNVTGLSYCRMCGAFFFDAIGVDHSMLSVGQILREEVRLSGYRETLFTYDSIHLAAQLRYIDPFIICGFETLLECAIHVVEKLSMHTSGSYEWAQRKSLCEEAEESTCLSPALVAFMVDSYAYAFGLTEQTAEYIISGTVSRPLNVTSFKADREYFRKGENVSLSWEVSQNEAVVAISDGSHQWTVPAKGEMEVSPNKDKAYTITAVAGGHSAAQKTVKLSLVKPVKIDAFKASRRTAYEGQPVTVSWKVSGEDRIELLVNDGNEYRKPMDVTGLKKKELRLSRDCQIVLTCSNRCYQTEQVLDIQVKGAPRFPVQQLTCLKRFPVIDFMGPVLPLTIGQDPLLSKKMMELQKSEQSLARRLWNNMTSLFSEI